MQNTKAAAGIILAFFLMYIFVLCIISVAMSQTKEIASNDKDKTNAGLNIIIVMAAILLCGICLAGFVIFALMLKWSGTKSYVATSLVFTFFTFFTIGSAITYGIEDYGGRVEKQYDANVVFYTTCFYSGIVFLVLVALMFYSFRSKDKSSGALESALGANQGSSRKTPARTSSTPSSSPSVTIVNT
jgi:magnesium-transporting ATPase (P-type)